MQILIEASEYERFQAHARREGKTLAEWVRQALRDTAERLPAVPVQDKLDALHQAARQELPAPDIEQMNDEIARGYFPGTHSEDAP
jgi:hypothetical protein